MPAKRLEFTNDTDIRLGFEIECVIKNAYISNNLGGVRLGPIWHNFKRSIYNLKCGINIGSDGSIRADNIDDCAVELRTKPMAPQDAMATLHKIFKLVNEFGYTNKSCGLHVNISSTHKRKMKNFNPVAFLSSNLWSQILKDFKRTSNNYCRPVVKLSNKPRITQIHQLAEFTKALTSKYRCVNFSNFGTGINPSSRIEIRGFGNVNYTNRFNDIASYVKRIEKLFKFSCDRLLMLSDLTKTLKV